MPLPPMVAGGNISPSRFVMPSSTNENECLQATADARTIGISQRGTRNPPIAGLDDGLAAVAGEQLQIFGPGEVAMLEIGAAVTPGTFLRSDANGRGIPVATAGQWYGARALQGGAANDFIQVLVITGLN